MKYRLSLTLLLSLILLLSGCNSSSGPGDNDRKNSTYDNERLEKFLDIPVYPGAEVVMFITDDRDREIPRRTKPATISLAIDNRDSVPAYYERVLGEQFMVDTSGGKTYYKLVFEKGSWEYEILVGQDTFENRPMFTISLTEKPH